MKGIAGTQTRGLQQQSELTVIDNTGAKVIEIITVPGYHGVARRSPKAAVGDMVIASVKKGTPAMRRQIRGVPSGAPTEPWCSSRTTPQSS